MTEPTAICGKMGLHKSALAMLVTSESVARINQRLRKIDPNMADINTPYKEIPLTHGKVALVDSEDYERVMQYNWYAYKATDGGWYVRRTTDKPKTVAYMLHRFILGDAPDEIDHKDGDGLNNQRHNLRPATASQNKHNYKVRSDSTTGFKGVRRIVRVRSGMRWIARIKLGGRDIWLGTFNTPEDAARAYDSRARELYGEFAWLNFPEEGIVQNGKRS